MVPRTRAQQSRGPCWRNCERSVPSAGPLVPDQKHVVVRRLSPNNRKIEVEKGKSTLFTSDMLRTMGFDLANVHPGTAERGDASSETSKIASVVGCLRTRERRQTLPCKSTKPGRRVDDGSMKRSGLVSGPSEGPSIHGIRRRGGIIFATALPSDGGRAALNRAVSERETNGAARLSVCYLFPDKRLSANERGGSQRGGRPDSLRRRRDGRLVDSHHRE